MTAERYQLTARSILDISQLMTVEGGLIKSGILVLQQHETLVLMMASGTRYIIMSTCHSKKRKKTY